MKGFNVHLKADKSRENKNPKWQIPKKTLSKIRLKNSHRICEISSLATLRTLSPASEFRNPFWFVLYMYIGQQLRRAKYETEGRWQGDEACFVVTFCACNCLPTDLTLTHLTSFKSRTDFFKYCLWNAVSFNGILLLLLSKCVRWGVVKVWSEVTPIRWLTGWCGLKVVWVNWALDGQPPMALWQYCRCHRVLLALLSGRHQSVVAALHSNVIGRDIGIEPIPNRTNQTRTLIQKKTKKNSNRTEPL